MQSADAFSVSFLARPSHPEASAFRMISRSIFSFFSFAVGVLSVFAKQVNEDQQVTMQNAQNIEAIIIQIVNESLARA
jgi:hypothetical protein